MLISYTYDQRQRPSSHLFQKGATRSTILVSAYEETITVVTADLLGLKLIVIHRRKTWELN